MGQSVYRVHLIPYGGDLTDNKWCVFDLCISNGIIGVGWAAPAYALKPTSDFVEYTSAHQSVGLDIDQSVRTLKNMKKGDLAWIRDPSKIYYLAEIRGPWEYRTSPLYRSFDILNIRKADIWQVSQDRVPKHVTANSFPKTVQNIANQTAISETIALWRDVQEREVFKNVD